MSVNTEGVIIVAQAQTPADAVQQGQVVPDQAGAANTTATTEAPGGEAPTVFPPFDATTFPSQLLWFAITFVALWQIMRRVAVPQLGSILENRRVRIEGDLREAERLRQETEKAAAAYEDALAEARRNAHAIAEETRSSIKADLDGKRAAVEAELAQKVADAEANVQRTKDAALGNVEAIAADTATALVQQLAGSVTPEEARDAVAEAARS
jgi:F-type H+-transporting ATPase subunit b